MVDLRENDGTGALLQLQLRRSLFMQAQAIRRRCAYKRSHPYPSTAAHVSHASDFRYRYPSPQKADFGLRSSVLCLSDRFTLPVKCRLVPNAELIGVFAMQNHYSRRTVAIIVIPVLFTALATVMVVLRIVGRRIRRVSLWLDDYVILASLVRCAGKD